MEILPQFPLPAANGSNTVSQNNIASNNSGAISDLPDYMVTSIDENTDANVREEDANRENEDERRARLLELVNSRINESKIEAKLSFDVENMEVYVSISDSKNGETISRFPSGDLKPFFEENRELLGETSVENQIDITA